jgi:mRNA-degrading endonuclease toxin of MazEF toxin-antitoxin module
MNKGEIWLSTIPSSEGHEQSGTRLNIIVATHNTGITTIIPLTSNQLAKRFSNTILIKKTIKNNLEKDSIALIFQIKSLDKSRFTKKIGNLEENDKKTIDKEILNYLKYKN